MGGGGNPAARLRSAGPEKKPRKEKPNSAGLEPFSHSSAVKPQSTENHRFDPFSSTTSALWLDPLPRVPPCPTNRTDKNLQKKEVTRSKSCSPSRGVHRSKKRGGSGILRLRTPLDRTPAGWRCGAGRRAWPGGTCLSIGEMPGRPSANGGPPWSAFRQL